MMNRGGKVRWAYKTIHFELKKESLLGSGFLDESEMEQVLNTYGGSGWELVSLLDTRDGAIGVLKQPLDSGMASLNAAVEEREEVAEVEEEPEEPPPAIRTMAEREEFPAWEDEDPYVEEEPAEDEQPAVASLEEEAAEDEEDVDDGPGVGSIRIE